MLERVYVVGSLMPVVSSCCPFPILVWLKIAVSVMLLVGLEILTFGLA